MIKESELPEIPTIPYPPDNTSIFASIIFRLPAKFKFGDSDSFYIPENVYIIGTMNDIDRSVESMDFAMRRRFAFKEVRAEDRMEMIEELFLKIDIDMDNEKLDSISTLIKNLSTEENLFTDLLNNRIKNLITN